MQAVAELAARQRAEQQRARRASSFRAAPPPRHPPPPPPARSACPSTRSVTPHLAVKTRSAKRAAFDAAVAKSKKEEEVQNCVLTVIVTQTLREWLSLV